MTTRKKKLEESETRVVKRSSIALNPINPKRHTNDAIKLQKKNLQKVGFLGGIVYNETSGHVIDGHRRLHAMDQIYGYDGTAETDYEVKVEVTHLDEKTEKEQLSYMAVGNTKPDLDLIAKYIDEIDYSDIGLSQTELNDILAFAQEDAPVVSNALDVGITIPDPSVPEAVTTKTQAEYDEGVRQMKEAKQRTKEKAQERALNESASLTLSFDNYESKALFCSLIGINDMDMFAKGEDVMKMIE